MSDKDLPPKQQDVLPYDYVEQDDEYMDYLAELATKEMEEEHLPDYAEYQKMMELCEEIAASNVKTVALPSDKKIIKDSSETIEAEFLDDNEFKHSSAEYKKYLELVHNKTLADILSKIKPVDLINTLICKMGDDLDNVIIEPDVQHPVSFVQDQRLHRDKLDITHVQMGD